MIIIIAGCNSDLLWKSDQTTEPPKRTRICFVEFLF